MLVKVRYDTSTTVMGVEQQRYWMHALQGDPLIGAYIRSQMRQNPQMRREIFNQPVCARCEKFAFHHKNGVQCPSCGHFEPTKTHTLKTHLKEGHFR